jgi:hypothetical protein
MKKVNISELFQTTLFFNSKEVIFELVKRLTMLKLNILLHHHHQLDQAEEIY